MKRILLWLLLFLLLASGGAAYCAYWVYKDLHTPVYHSKSGRYIEIPRGSSPSAVLRRLTSEGVLRHESLLAVYLKVTGSGSRFKAGEYTFASPIAPLAVFEKLEQGEQRLVRFTVIEGWTRWDIANAMAKMPELGLSNAETVLALMNDVSQIRDLDPQAQNLEGYVYPDTYEFPPATTPKTLVEMMVKRSLAAWTSEAATRARALNMTPRQIVTTASLIETEAKLNSERPLIASVIYNRLKTHTPLGIDSSIIYASKLAGKWKNDGKVYKSDVDRRSPYNTRLNTGLPPGPIASPGASSFQAALRPAQTDYLFYVRDPARNDGAHNFYANGSDFNRGVQALRIWERQRDEENVRRQAGHAR
jgi:UPF0755 protein